MLFLIAGPAAAPAFADIAVLQTKPTAGSTLTAPITDVRLSFTEAVDQNYSSVKVIGPDGADYADGDLDVVLNSNVVQPVRRLPPGTYKTSWSVGLANPDQAQGEFTFTVAESAVLATEDEQATAVHDNPNSGYGVWLLLGALGALVVALFVVMIVRQTKRETDLPPYRGDRGMDF